eukprot:6213407-Pleurochrysis_carterae.AAC.2
MTTFEKYIYMLLLVLNYLFAVVKLRTRARLAVVCESGEKGSTGIDLASKARSAPARASLVQRRFGQALLGTILLDRITDSMLGWLEYYTTVYSTKLITPWPRLIRRAKLASAVLSPLSRARFGRVDPDELGSLRPR